MTTFTYNQCQDCNSPGSQRPQPIVPPLQETFQRYKQVAESVNRSEFDRFVQHIKERWHPLPAAENEWEDGYRGEGWTEEAALAMCVYKLALQWVPDLHEPPTCEAEKLEQVYFAPLESILEEIGPAASEPAPRRDIAVTLDILQKNLRQAFEELNPRTAFVDLPKDYQELLHLTDCVRPAGIPSEHSHTILIGGVNTAGMHPHKAVTPQNMSLVCRHVPAYHGLQPLVAWRLGGCIQHRDIYYALCRNLNDETAELSWRVLDQQDINVDVYDSLAHFLRHETDHVEKDPHGNAKALVLRDHEVYPEDGMYLC